MTIDLGLLKKLKLTLSQLVGKSSVFSSELMQDIQTILVRVQSIPMIRQNVECHRKIVEILETFEKSIHLIEEAYGKQLSVERKTQFLSGVWELVKHVTGQFCEYLDILVLKFDNSFLMEASRESLQETLKLSPRKMQAQRSLEHHPNQFPMQWSKETFRGVQQQNSSTGFQQENAFSNPFNGTGTLS